jgi:Reverse transcriptase (RNA-dependent DNA polymerase)
VKEDIYLEPPEGLQLLLDKDPKLAKLMAKLGWSATDDLVLQLQKALYGLKQSPRVWQQKVASLLQKLGYKPLISDSAAYYNSTTGLFVITYVDDCLIVGPSLLAINRLKTTISSVYEIEDRGEATLFLGIEIVRDRAKRLLWIHQKHYIQTAVTHFGLEDAKSVRIPLQPTLLGQPSAEGPSVPREKQKLYQSIVGTAMYCLTQTRPDLAFALQWLSRQLQHPTLQHLSAAKGVLRYLKGSQDIAVCYGTETDLIPKAYCDSDYAGCKTTAKSTYGYLFTVAGGPISWKSKRSTTVALSTLEAEYTAISESVREIQWLHGLYREMQFPIQGPILLHSDNQGAISTANDPKHHNRTKHTLVRFEYVRQEVRKSTVAIQYLDTASMPADGLTKPLNTTKFSVFVSLMGLQQLPIIKQAV